MFSQVLETLSPFAREFALRGKRLHLVGGAVRNLWLGRSVQDFDFTTDARPEEVMGYFRRVIPTGLAHGTVTVLFQGRSYEVTTYRLDGTYSDSRRPDEVTFTGDLAEDLSRRDFTINALALDLVTGELVDLYGGRADLEAGVLRAIGDPGRRFDEDALRILRLYRFAAQLGFDIDEATRRAAEVRVPRLAAVSKERIREELLKALAGAHPARAWAPLEELGVLANLFAPLALRPLGPELWARFAAWKPDLRWPLWLTLAAGPQLVDWDAALRRLTLSNADREAILGPARALALLGTDRPRGLLAKALIEAWGSRARASLGADYLEAWAGVGGGFDDRELLAEVRRVAATDEPVFLADLAVNGRDLMAWGIPPGPQVGTTLRELLERVWVTPQANDREVLRSWVASR